MKKLLPIFLLYSSWCMASDTTLVPRKGFYGYNSMFDSAERRKTNEACALVANLIASQAPAAVLQDAVTRADPNGWVKQEWIFPPEIRENVFSLLDIAIEKQHADAVKVLLHAKADPNVKTYGKHYWKYHTYPLQAALSRGNPIIVKSLLDYKANIRSRRSDEMPHQYDFFLKAPANENSFEIIRVLGEAQVDIYYGFPDVSCGSWGHPSECRKDWCRYLALVQHPWFTCDPRKPRSKYNCKGFHMMTDRDKAFQEVIAKYFRSKKSKLIKQNESDESSEYSDSDELDHTETSAKEHAETKHAELQAQQQVPASHGVSLQNEQPHEVPIQTKPSRVKGMDLVRMAAAARARKEQSTAGQRPNFCWECAQYGSPGHPIIPSSSHAHD